MAVATQSSSQKSQSLVVEVVDVVRRVLPLRYEYECLVIIVEAVGGPSGMVKITGVSQSDVSVGHRYVSHDVVGHSSVGQVEPGQLSGGSQVGVIVGPPYVEDSSGHGQVSVGSPKGVVGVGTQSEYPYFDTTESMQKIRASVVGEG